MPNEFSFGMVILKPIDFGTTLLCIVLSENTLSGIDRLEHSFGRKCLGNSHEFHRALPSYTDRRQRRFDLLQSIRNSLFSLCHLRPLSSNCGSAAL